MAMPKLDKQLLIAEIVTEIRERLNELPRYGISETDWMLKEDKNGNYITVDSVKNLLKEQMKKI
ncbi:MAG: hypothetical protein WC346_18420 [Methanogenium sp.]|jgi:hypothetical protein